MTSLSTRTGTDEADMLVNLFEDGVGERAARSALERVFKTEAGRELCRQMFLEPRASGE